MSLAAVSPASHPALATPIRVLLEHDRQDLLAALRNGRSPVFARWPDLAGEWIIGSARSATGAAALALDCAWPATDFEPVQIEFEFHLAAMPPIRILAEAWLPV